MKETPRMPNDVQRFLNTAANIVATDAAEYLKSYVLMRLRHYQITSPIEQLLFIATHAMSTVLGLDGGLIIQPQHPVGPYRVDYFLWTIDRETRAVQKRAALECDSWQYDDRTPEGSTVEKQRDRYLQRQGILTLHYSGQEIVADPFLVAAEALATVDQTEFPILNDEGTYVVDKGFNRNQYFYSRMKELATKTDVVARAESILRGIQ